MLEESEELLHGRRRRRRYVVGSPRAPLSFPLLLQCCCYYYYTALLLLLLYQSRHRCHTSSWLTYFTRESGTTNLAAAASLSSSVWANCFPESSFQFHCFRKRFILSIFCLYLQSLSPSSLFWSCFQKMRQVSILGFFQFQASKMEFEYLLKKGIFLHRKYLAFPRYVSPYGIPGKRRLLPWPLWYHSHMRLYSRRSSSIAGESSFHGARDGLHHTRTLD